MRNLRPSTKAWAALIAGTALYEALCPVGETLSEGLDDFCDKPIGKVVVGAIGAVTVAHLINVMPERIDPYHQMSLIKERLR